MTWNLAAELNGTSSSPTLLAAALAALVLCLLPGYGLLRLCLPDIGRLRSVAAGPAVTAGLLYVTGQFLSLRGIPVNAWLGLAAVVLGCVATALAERRHLPCARGTAWTTDRLLLPGAAALGSLVGAAIWAVSIGSLTAVPPHHDGFHHGYFVARILNFGTLDPSVVVADDVLSTSGDTAYYPFALHEQAAMVVQVTGVDVASAFTLVSLICLLVALPAGMVVVTWRLFPNRSLVAAVAGLVAVLAPGLTYSTTWWGGYALMVGLAVTLGALELLLRLGTRLALAGIVLAALSLAGVAGIHTSELPLLAIMSVVLAIGATSSPRRMREAAKRVVVVATAFFVALIMLAPVIAQLVGGYEERQYPVSAMGVPISQALAEVFALLVFVPPPTPAAMVLTFWGGLIAAAVMKQARAWASLWLLFAVLYIWLWSYPSVVVNAITAFWYSDPFRLAYIIVLLAVPFVAFGIGAPLESWKRSRFHVRNGTRASQGFGPHSLTVVGGVVSLILLGLLAVTGTASSVSTVQRNYKDFSVIGADERAAFQFLAHNVGAGERVINQHGDGSTWMYALYGVAPLIPIKSTDTSTWTDRLYLVRHAAVVGVDPRAAALARRYKARYVYVSRTLFRKDDRELSVEDMQRSSGYRPVFRAGDVYVFERAAL